MQVSVLCAATSSLPYGARGCAQSRAMCCTVPLKIAHRAAPRTTPRCPRNAPCGWLEAGRRPASRARCYAPARWVLQQRGVFYPPSTAPPSRRSHQPTKPLAAVDAPKGSPSPAPRAAPDRYVATPTSAAVRNKLVSPSTLMTIPPSRWNSVTETLSAGQARPRGAGSAWRRGATRRHATGVGLVRRGDSPAAGGRPRRPRRFGGLAGAAPHRPPAAAASLTVGTPPPVCSC